MDLRAWDSEDSGSVTNPIPAGLSEEDLKKMSDFQVRIYGELTQEVLEAILVGYMVHDSDLADRINTKENVDVLLECGLKGELFDNSSYGALFDDMQAHVRANRRAMTLDESEQKCISLGQTHDQAMMYRLALARCHAAMISRRIDVRILIRRMQNHYRLKKSDTIIQKFLKDRVDPSVGPEKALDGFKYNVAKDLTTMDSSVLKEYDWIADCNTDVAWLLDMKENPEKYAGYMCGMEFIDKMTGGFRPGQLTVFVGRHGGYKSTVMMNIGYGLWEKGYDVLYASLEMEAKLVKSKLLCCGSKDTHPRHALDWGHVYNGLITQPGDWEKLKQLRVAIENTPPGPEKDAIIKKSIRLGECTKDRFEDKPDTEIIKEFYDQMGSKKNRFKIVNVGQSEKIRPSQIEKYVEERIEIFKPQVVIVDYLALVASETPYPDRRDLEVGDVCKRFRAMGDRLGFSVVSAAQYKRGAIERIRKYGFNQPEKAQFSTDDIAESNQIGADADNVFMLWPTDGTHLMSYVPKCRNGASDIKGQMVEIMAQHCKISDNISNTDDIKNEITISEANALVKMEPMFPSIPLDEFGEQDADAQSNESREDNDLGF